MTRPIKTSDDIRLNHYINLMVNVDDNLIKKFNSNNDLGMVNMLFVGFLGTKNNDEIKSHFNDYVSDNDKKIVQEFSCKFASLNLDDKKKVFYSFLEKKGIEVTDETKKNLETRLANSADLILKHPSEYQKYSEDEAKQTFATILQRQSTATQIKPQASNYQPAERQAENINSNSSNSATSKSHPWLDLLIPSPTNQKITKEDLTKIFKYFMTTTDKEFFDRYKTQPQKLNQQQINNLEILEKFGKHFKELSFKDKTDYFFQALEYKGYKLPDERDKVLNGLAEIHNIYSQKTSDQNKQQNTRSPSSIQSSRSAIRESPAPKYTQNNLQSPSQSIPVSHSPSSKYLSDFMNKYKNDFDMVLLDMPDKNRPLDPSQLTGFYRTNIAEMLMDINYKDKSKDNLTGEEMIYKLFGENTKIKGLSLDDIGEAIKEESKRLETILRKQNNDGIDIGQRAKKLLQEADQKSGYVHGASRALDTSRFQGTSGVDGTSRFQDTSGVDGTSRFQGTRGVQVSGKSQTHRPTSDQGNPVGANSKSNSNYWTELITSSRSSGTTPSSPIRR